MTNPEATRFLIEASSEFLGAADTALGAYAGILGARSGGATSPDPRVLGGFLAGRAALSKRLNDIARNGLAPVKPVLECNAFELMDPKRRDAAVAKVRADLEAREKAIRDHQRAIEDLDQIKAGAEAKHQAAREFQQSIRAVQNLTDPYSGLHGTYLQAIDGAQQVVNGTSSIGRDVDAARRRLSRDLAEIQEHAAYDRAILTNLGL